MSGLFEPGVPLMVLGFAVIIPRITTLVVGVGILAFLAWSLLLW